jgi:hypothetical protein
LKKHCPQLFKLRETLGSDWHEEID